MTNPSVTSPRPGRRAPTPAEAAALYDKGQSAYQIAEAHGITRQGAAARIRAGGLGGVTWCPLCRTYEDLSLINAEAVSYMHARWGL